MNLLVDGGVCGRMENSPHQSRFAESAGSLAKPLAPEEICAGDYVTVLHEICELPSFLWCSDGALTRRDELVRMKLMPKRGGVPLKVKSVCLPFVLVKHPSGSKRPLDVRQCRLAKLDREYAEAAWRSAAKKRRRKSRD